MASENHQECETSGKPETIFQDDQQVKNHDNLDFSCSDEFLVDSETPIRRRHVNISSLSLFGRSDMPPDHSQDMIQDDITTPTSYLNANVNNSNKDVITSSTQEGLVDIPSEEDTTENDSINIEADPTNSTFEMADNYILSGQGRNTIAGRNRPSTQYFNSLRDEAVSVFFMKYSEYIITINESGGKLSITMPEHWDTSTITEKIKIVAEAMIKKQ